MSFLLPLIGAVGGGVAGFLLGEMLHVGYGGTTIDMRYPLLAAGTLVGYFIGWLVAKKPTEGKDNSDSA
ncbi:MAG: hypothetical protein HQ501_02495 [Rhodospirillales bacterium]|nr:hypothetical protein [Rhodospirillales bacterium]